MPVTNYLWDEQNCLAESDENDVIQAVYTNEPETYGNLISERQGATSLYHHYDALGSTRQLTNSAGSVSDTWLYDAWGNQIARTGTTGIAFTWIGEIGYNYDPETGTFWVRVQPLEPGIARWTASDISQLMEELNGYRYCQARPVSCTDPSGTLSIPRPLVTQGISCALMQWQHPWVLLRTEANGYIIQRVIITAYGEPCTCDGKCPDPQYSSVDGGFVRSVGTTVFRSSSRCPPEGDKGYVVEDGAQPEAFSFWELWTVIGGKIYTGDRQSLAPLRRIVADSLKFEWFPSLPSSCGDFSLTAAAWWYPTQSRPPAAPPPGGWEIWKSGMVPARDLASTCDIGAASSSLGSQQVTKGMLWQFECCDKAKNRGIVTVKNPTGDWFFQDEDFSGKAGGI